MTSTNQPRFNLIKAIILLLLVLLTVCLFLFGFCEHDDMALYYGTMAAVITALLGKAWTT